MDRDAVILLTQRKSLGVGLLLTLFFGGFGVFYASVLGGVLLSAIQVLFFVIALATFGFGVVLLLPLWFVAVIWTCVAINGHNARLMARTYARS
jgi:hypothetical protein